MKVLALGGCGEMGGYTVRTLARREEISSILVADIDGERAGAFARDLPDSVTGAQLDVTDEPALSQAAAEADLVINFVGPYYRFGAVVLNQCIQRKTNYLDICDDWEPTLELLDLDEAAKKAGITAVIGLGASPGITNVLARKAAAELDQVEALFTGWDLAGAKPEKIGPEPSAATVHGMHQLTGTIRVFDGGQFVEQKPVRKIMVAYPGFGVHPVYTIGHPESVTMPRYIKGLQQSQNVFLSDSFTVMGIKGIAMLVDKGLIDERKAAWIAEKATGAAKADYTPAKRLGELLMSMGTGLPPLFALARGIKDNRPASAACAILSAPDGGMGGATGVPTAVGAIMMAKGEIKQKGVFAPEGVVDPEEFFELLAPLCRPMPANGEDLVLTTRSWERPDPQELQNVVAHRFGLL